jgi:tetratricopeptide (TPR) repeat protein
MTTRKKEGDRKVVPRFHALAAATRQGETASALKNGNVVYGLDPAARAEALATLKVDWAEHHSSAFAADLVAAALVAGDVEAGKDAAQFLLGEARHSLDRQLARRLLGEDIFANDEDFDPSERESVYERLRALKTSVRADPRTALLWAELARGYVALGQREQADHAMRVALGLLPDHRFLLRSAARLSLHLDDPERAHRLLQVAPATPHDPWLVAAEIAVAPLAGRQSRLIKHGRRLIASDRFHPGSLSELSSALATEAFAAGRSRDARKLFEQSLDRPTENAVAQAAWASRKGAHVEIGEDLLEVEGSFEARAQALSQIGDVEGTLKNIWAWLRTEPFAAVPAVFGSHEAALARNYDEAIRFASFGLVANPEEFLLRNNLAFALASIGRVREAQDQVQLIREAVLTSEERLTLQATRGLIAFRAGDVVHGRELYEQTIADAQDVTQKALAMIMLAREEIVAHTPLGVVTRLAAEQVVASAKDAPSARADKLSAWLDHLSEAASEGPTS